MHILINHSSMVPIYEQVADQVKKNIISGELKEGQVLPSVRALSSQLRIRAVEDDFKKAVDKATAAGMRPEEILEIVKIMLEV